MQDSLRMDSGSDKEDVEAEWVKNGTSILSKATLFAKALRLKRSWHIWELKKKKALWLHNMENEEREGYQMKCEKLAGARSGKTCWF